MGTRIGSMALALVVLLGVSALAWAAPAEKSTAPTEEAEGPCEVAGTPVEELGVTENANGVVYYYDDRVPEVWVTIGSNHGLRSEAELAFVRGDRVVANGSVKEVRQIDCVVSPAECTPAGTILLGDGVRVLRNGSRAALDAQIRRDQMEHMLTTAAITAILTGSIYAARH